MWPKPNGRPSNRSKYGNVHRQLRALTLLNGLIQNTGPDFQRGFWDKAIRERLLISATDQVSDPRVKAKCRAIFIEWALTYKGSPGTEELAELFKSYAPHIQSSSSSSQSQFNASRGSEAEPSAKARKSSVSNTLAGTTSFSKSDPSSSQVSSSVKSKDKPPPSDSLSKKDLSHLSETLGSAAVASTDLLNALKLVNREEKRVSEDAQVMERVKNCRSLRKTVLKYIQKVETEPWLGRLIHANEELVNALTAFEILDKSVDDDSDSEHDDGPLKGSTRSSSSPREADPVAAFARLRLEGNAAPPPPRPPKGGLGRTTTTTTPYGKGKEKDVGSDESDSGDSEDEDNPFADRNAVE